MCGVRHQDGDYWRQRIDARNGILGRQVPQREAARLRDTLARHGVGAQACCEQLHGARVDGVSLARADLLLPRASALLERADDLLPSSPEAKRLMATATTLLEALDGILKDDESNAELKAGVKDARALVDDLRLLVRGAAVGVGDGKALRATLEKLPPLLIKTGQVEDQVLAVDLEAFISDTRATLHRADALMDALGRGPAGDAAQQTKLATELSSTLRSLDGAARRADRLMTQIENKEGAVGKLWGDAAVADDVKSILKAVREDPVKFLFR